MEGILREHANPTRTTAEADRTSRHYILKGVELKRDTRIE